ncbi:class I SAM-dependent methyltransferase [Kitasatospora sp. NPDC059327]|uniref:class I SAM-dependent methyltransferase n=1 Tax=Kitasatospora sp. NPDC059327 TaxID=3346803 RepID=UPI00367BEFDD
MTTASMTYWEPLWSQGSRYRQLDDTEDRLLERHLGTGRGRPALDIGSGEGSLTRRLAELGYRATGIDCSPSAVALASAHDPGPDRVSVWQCMDFTTDDLGALPAPAYAVITCRLVYRWIDDKAAFVDRVRRLLTPRAGRSGSSPRSPAAAPPPTPCRTSASRRPRPNSSPRDGQPSTPPTSTSCAAMPCAPDPHPAI